METSDTRVALQYQMVRLNVRGVYPCWVEALELLHRNTPGLKPKEYVRPRMRPAPGFQLSRVVTVGPAHCRIEDRITGDLEGKTVLFSVRRLPGAVISVDGLQKLRSMTGWGSDGRQTIDVYTATPRGSGIRYTCNIEPGAARGRS
jgi:hypothetical protein